MRDLLSNRHRIYKYTEEEREALAQSILHYRKKGLKYREIAVEMAMPLGTLTSLYFKYIKHGVPKL